MSAASDNVREAATPVQPWSLRSLRVSVIMAVRNEEDFIERSVRGILAQDYPPELIQVIIADGMSTDRTRQLLEWIAATDSMNRIRIIDNPKRIVAAGLNLALTEADGDIVVRVDGHTVIAPDYVRQCARLLSEGVADNVGGPIAPAGAGWMGRAIALAMTSAFGTGGASFHNDRREGYVDTVYLGAWRRSLFDLGSSANKSGSRQRDPTALVDRPAASDNTMSRRIRLAGFDERFVRNQDDELNYRLRHLGGRIYLSPQIRSQYFNRGSLRALARQYFGYGLWKPRVLWQHPLQVQARQFVAPLFVLALVALVPIVWFAPGLRPLLMIVAGFYLLLNVTASIMAARRQTLELLILPLVFVTLHFSYGLGFFVGVLEALWCLAPSRAETRKEHYADG
jgi:succinoglycan biosynthesis protein ExoA